MSSDQLSLPTRYDAPKAPFAPTSETSYEAALAVEHHLTRQEARILATLRAFASTGLDQEQIADRTGLSRASVSARLSDTGAGLCSPDRDGGALVLKTERKRRFRSGRNGHVYETLVK